MPLIPDEIHQYQIFKEDKDINTTNTSVVCRAWDKELRREVALKILLPNRESEKPRFKREAQVAAKFEHPHVMKVYDAYFGEDYYYMVMPYMKAGSLAHYVTERQQSHSSKYLAPSQALPIIKQVGEGLKYIHNFPPGYIHRDIKPGNIILGNDGLWKLSDFGAIEVDDPELTKLPGFGGYTPVWAPREQINPELLQGEKLDVRADIFSLGKVLRWMVAGDDLRSSLQLDKRLQKIIDTAMADDRKDRYPSVEAMLLDIDKLMSQPSRLPLMLMGCGGLIAALLLALVVLPPGVLAAVLAGIFGTSPPTALPSVAFLPTPPQAPTMVVNQTVLVPTQLVPSPQPTSAPTVAPTITPSAIAAATVQSVPTANSSDVITSTEKPLPTVTVSALVTVTGSPSVIPSSSATATATVQSASTTSSSNVITPTEQPSPTVTAFTPITVTPMTTPTTAPTTAPSAGVRPAITSVVSATPTRRPSQVALQMESSPGIAARPGKFLPKCEWNLVEDKKSENNSWKVAFSFTIPQQVGPPYSQYTVVFWRTNSAEKLGFSNFTLCNDGKIADINFVKVETLLNKSEIHAYDLFMIRLVDKNRKEVMRSCLLITAEPIDKAPSLSWDSKLGNADPRCRQWQLK